MASRAARIAAWIAEQNFATIGGPEYERLCAAFPEIPERSLRVYLREAGVPLTALVEGVRQDSADNLARTLIALQHQYLNDPDSAGACRRMVITAKDHARLAARKHPEKRQMIEWMLVWLDNPPVFEAWFKARSARLKLESCDRS